MSLQSTPTPPEALSKSDVADVKNVGEPDGDENRERVDALVRQIAENLEAFPARERARLAELHGLDAEEVETSLGIELFIREALPGESLGLPYHARYWDKTAKAFAWGAYGCERLLEDDIGQHLAGDRTIAVSWPEMVNAIELDLDAKTPEQRRTLSARVHAVARAFGWTGAGDLPGVLWRSSKGGGLRFRVALTESLPRDAVRRSARAALEAAGVYVSPKVGVELWPSGRQTLRAPAGDGFALVQIAGDGFVYDERADVESWALAIRARRRPVMELLPGYTEALPVAEDDADDEDAGPISGIRRRGMPSVAERVLEACAAGTLRRVKDIRSVVYGRSETIERAVKALRRAHKLMKRGGFYVVVVKPPVGTRRRRAAGTPSTPSEPAKNPANSPPSTTPVFSTDQSTSLILSPGVPLGTLRDKTLEKDPLVTLKEEVGSSHGFTTQRKYRNTGGRGPSKPAKSKAIKADRERASGWTTEYAREFASRGWAPGERMEAYRALTFLWALEGLSNGEARAELRNVLARGDHTSKDLSGDKAAGTRAAMLNAVPKRMNQLREMFAENETEASLKRREESPSGCALASIGRPAMGWRDELLASVPADEAARVDALITREAPATSPTMRRALCLLHAAVRRGARAGGDGIAVCRSLARKISGGRYWICPVTGDRRAASTILVRLARHVGILGETLRAASRSEHIARCYALPTIFAPMAVAA